LLVVDEHGCNCKMMSGLGIPLLALRAIGYARDCISPQPLSSTGHGRSMTPPRRRRTSDGARALAGGLGQQSRKRMQIARLPV
jgi:hypothetical protein